MCTMVEISQYSEVDTVVRSSTDLEVLSTSGLSLPSYNFKGLKIMSHATSNHQHHTSTIYDK